MRVGSSNAETKTARGSKLTTTTTAQNNLTELRILLNQISLANDPKKIKALKEQASAIISALKFDFKDLAEDRLAEIERLDYVPSF